MMKRDIYDCNNGVKILPPHRHRFRDIVCRRRELNPLNMSKDVDSSVIGIQVHPSPSLGNQVV